MPFARGVLGPAAVSLLVLAAPVVCGCLGESERRVRLQAVIVTRGQEVKPLAILAVNGCPLSEVRGAVAATINAHDARLQMRREEVARLAAAYDAAVAIARAKVDSARTALAEFRREHDENEPRDTEAAANGGAAAGELDRALRQREQDRAEVTWQRERLAAIQPLEQAVAAAERDLEAAERRSDDSIELTASAVSPDLFPGLPAPARTWTTDVDGRVIVRVPANEPWVVWAATSRQAGGSEERYRWLVRLPEEQAKDDTLYLSGDNLHDGGVPPWLRE